MIKTIVQMIFEQHATDTLRKALAEVERAAAGKLHNESLSDYITRLASLKYDAERTNRELDSYREENQRHYAISAENGRVDEEPVEDYMVRVWHSLGVAQRFAEDMQAKLKTKDATIKALRDDRALMDEWHGVSLENGRLPDELMTDYMVRVWDSLQVAQRFAEDQKEKLQAANQRIAELLCEPDKAVETLRDLESVANDNGRKEGESVLDFITRVVCELVTAQTQVSMLQKRAIVYGCNAQESVIDFMARTKNEIKSLQNRLSIIDDASDKNGCGRTEETEEFIARIALERKDLAEQVKDLKAGEAESKAAAEEYGVLPDETHAQFIKRVLGDLATAKEEARRERERGNRINAESEENMKKLWKCANDLGRTDYEPLWSFMDRQAAEIAKHQESAAQLSKSLGDSISLANARALEIEALKHEVASEHKRGNIINSEYEATVSNIMAAATKLGRAAFESPEAFMQRQADEITELTRRTPKEINDAYGCADKLGRVSSESIIDFMKRQDAALASQTNHTSDIAKSLDLFRQDAQDKGQELLKVRAWHEEKLQKIRELEAELSLVTKQLQSWQVCWDTYAQLCKFATSCGMTGDESVKQFIERKIIEASTVTADRDRIRAELAAILAEANKIGRCGGDPVALIRQGQNDLDARIAAEREAEDIKKRWRALNEHSSLKGMYGNETTAEFITRQHRLAVERQEALDRASETIRRLTLDLENAIVDKVLAGNGAKEVARLSELVASLQVELDKAKGQYSGIMVQLGNETPLQLIERMQRLVADHRASTIPHDERAALVAEIADLRKRLEKSQRDHAEVAHELNTARNGANECGMQAGEKLRAFIYRKRAELLDALHSKDRIQLLANENVDKLRAALETVENQSAAIAEAKQATEKYTEVVQTAAKLRDWAFTIRHKVLVKLVHDKAMTEYDNIMKELDGKAGTDGR